MNYFKILHFCTLVIISTALAKQNDWKDIFTLFPFIESNNRVSTDPIYTGNRHPAAHFVDNVLKRQDNNVDSFQRAKLAPRSCSGCCCKPSYYKPRKIELSPDISMTVMEVGDCNGACRGLQMCEKEASTVSWIRVLRELDLPFIINTTTIYTSCSCVP